MLGKLLKYELKSSARTLIPLYIGILILSIVCGIFFATQIQDFMYSDNMSLFFGILYMLLFALLVAMGVLTVVSIIQRFYKNLLGDEGFLMFTLPVSSTTLLLSKMLAAMLWIIASSVVGVLSIMITMFIPLFFSGELNITWSDFVYFMQIAWESLFNTPALPTFMFQLLLGGFISIIVTILMAYVSMMIGQLQPFSRHQIIVSFIAFFLIGWAFSTLYALLPFNDISYNFISVTGTSVSGLEGLTRAFWIPLIESIVQAVILFVGTDWLMKHKLNL